MGDARDRVDVHEDKDKNLVTATFELPGINKQDVSIDVHNNHITISGETKLESDREEKGFVVCERRFGRFARSLPVPEGVKVRIYDFTRISSVDAHDVLCSPRISVHRWKMGF